VTETQTKILTIIQTLIEAKQPPAVGLDESLFDAGVLDSFLLPGLVVALEKTFGIKIPDADLSSQKFESINLITEYIRSRS